MKRVFDAHSHGISTTASIIVVIIIIASAAVGLLLYSTSTGVRSTMQTTMNDIRNIEVNGTYTVNGSNLAGTLDVIYPNSAQAGNINATITNASVTLRCNDSFFVINADGKVIVNLTIIGNSNSVSMDGLRLNLIIDGNNNNITVMPQNVIIYGKQINGEGDQFTTRPLPP